MSKLSKSAFAPPANGVPMTEALSDHERERLARNEGKIHDALLSFVEMGEALEDIRVNRLYREHYRSFEEYCFKRWGFGGKRGYQYIGASKAAESLSTKVDIAPTNECQMRPLVGLSDDQAVEAWKLAEKKAEKREITGRLVQEAADEVRGVSLKVSTSESDRDLSALDRLCGKLSAKADWNDNEKVRFRMILKKLMRIARETGILDEA